MAAFSFCWPRLPFPDKSACDQSKRSPFPRHKQNAFLFSISGFCLMSTQWVHNSRFGLLLAQITKGGGASALHTVEKVNERCSWSWMRETQAQSLTSGKKPLFCHTVVLFTAFWFYWIFKPDALIYPGLKEKIDLRPFFVNFLYLLIVLDNNVFVCFLVYYLTMTVILL